MFIHMCRYKIIIYHAITFLCGELLFYLLILNSPHRRLETALTGSIVKNVQKRYTSFSIGCLQVTPHISYSYFQKNDITCL